MNKDDNDETDNVFVSDVMNFLMEGLDRMIDPFSNPTIDVFEEPIHEDEEIRSDVEIDNRLETEAVADATKLVDQVEVKCGDENVVGGGDFDGVVDCDHVEMVIPTIDTIIMKVNEEVMNEEQAVVSGTAVLDGTDVVKTLDATCSVAIAERERELRVRNPGVFVREPYTDAFGSADSKPKKCSQEENE